MPKLNELFQVTYGNKFDLNKLERRTRSNGGVSFVGRSQRNLGVSSTVVPIDGVEPYEAGLITVALGGTKLLSSFVQQHPFYTAQNVAVLRPLSPMTFAQKLYMCVAIRANRFRYGAFGREANRTLRVLEVPGLDEFPAWVGKMGVGLEVAPEVLQTVETWSDHEPAPAKAEEGLAPLSSLFDVHYGSNLELNRLVLAADGFNFVSRTSRNNGVSAHVEKIPGLEPIPGGVLTVAGGGSVLETFYQVEPFYSGRDLYYLVPRQPMTPEEMLFYARCIRANQYRYSYGRQANRTLKELRVPARACIPSWVYGAARRVVSRVRELVAS
jgi:hypothetical protein